MAGAKRPDAALFIATIIILTIGLVMVFSASYSTAGQDVNDSLYFIKRQMIWALIGLCLMYVAVRVDYHFWRQFALPGVLAALGLLGLVLVVGNEALGARRWIAVGPVSIQPSELAKLAIINFIAAYVVGRRHLIDRFWLGFAVPIGVAVLAVGLIMLEPDLGTSLAIIGVATLMMFAAGSHMKHILALAASAIPAVVLLILIEPYRMKRLLAFANPWEDPLGTGWNIIQSLYAVGSGGLFGLGLGASRQKFHYLPEQHTDFIFAILSEELGLVGGLVIIALFLVLAWRGYRAALKAPDLYGTMLAVGITTMVVLQAAMNIAVVTSMIPATGITLPLISAGGSSLSITLAGLGVLMNISAAGAVGREE